MGSIDLGFQKLDVDWVLEKLELSEKVELLAGIDFWHTKAIPRLNIPSLRTSDGPNGIRGTRFFKGVPAACFPCGTGLAATWDVDLIEAGGRLMGKEAIAKGVHVILGPTTNMQRSPLGGRGFESFSEDPFLAGAMTAATVKGIQSTGVAATVKHFVCNDEEDERQAVDSIVTERALREIYLMPFQIAQRDSKPWCYMTAYNKVNGTHASESPKLLNELLRKEWGFDGLVMSDWFGTYASTPSIRAGLDLEMPGPPAVRKENVQLALRSNQLSIHELDQPILNVLNLINRVGPLNIPENAPETTIDSPHTAAMLRHMANQSLVLCKNEGSILPLNPKKPIAIIGPNAQIATFSGGGSASLLPYYAVTPFEGISSQAESEVHYTMGALAYKNLPDLGPLVHTVDGRPGLLADVYSSPPAPSSPRQVLETIHVTSLNMFLADYTHPLVDSSRFWMTLHGTLTVPKSCTFRFGMAVCGTARLYVDDTCVVDNATRQTLGENFFASGTIEETGTIELDADQTYSIRVEFGSSSTQKIQRKGATLVPGGGLRIGGLPVTDPAVELEQAVQLARGVEQVVICAGLNAEFESEGYDRPDMSLPPAVDKLISAVSAANPRTVVVMQTGTPVKMPWLDQVPAVLQAWYGGNETGNAIADGLFGRVNPSGRMPLSWPKRCEDNPTYLNFGSQRGRTLYGEDIFVGYRYYEKVNRDVAFRFGHGLSYTTFEVRGLRVYSETVDRGLEKSDNISIDCTVQNTGSRAGAYVVQAYVTQRTPSVLRPVRELKGFAKVFLEPGENKKVEILVQKKYAASWWDEERDAWIMEKGSYDVLVSGGTGKEHGEGMLKGSFEVTKIAWWRGI